MVWHRTTRLREGLFRISEPFAAIEPGLGVSTANMYLVIGSERAALVDSGMGVGDVREEIAKVTALPCIVLNTHHHWDHVGANELFAESAIHEREARLVAREQDIGEYRDAFRSPAVAGVLPPSFDPETYRIIPRVPTRTLRDGDLIDLGGVRLRALHTPGHSPGHLCYLDEARGILFTGDTAYDGPVFACFGGSNPQALARTAARLAAMPGPVLLCPGHNDIIEDPGWLAYFARCVAESVAGSVEGHLRQRPVSGWEFRFGTLAIWLRA